jgi:hypothetical protein
MVDPVNLTGLDAEMIKKTGVRPDHDLTGSHFTLKDAGFPGFVRLEIPVSLALEGDIIQELNKLQGDILELRRRFGTSQISWAFELQILVRAANARLKQRARLSRQHKI